MKYFLGIVLAFFARRVKNDYAAATVRDPFESFQEESHPVEQNRGISFSICFDLTMNLLLSRFVSLSALSFSSPLIFFFFFSIYLLT